MVELDWVATTVVVTAKLALVFCAGTVTERGTLTPVWLLVSFTTMPPTGALPLRTTVPVLGEPPVTVDGLRLTEVSEGALTVSVAVKVTAPRLAESVALF
jgi:hypothetical protein